MIGQRMGNGTVDKGHRGNGDPSRPARQRRRQKRADARRGAS